MFLSIRDNSRAKLPSFSGGCSERKAVKQAERKRIFYVRFVSVRFEPEVYREKGIGGKAIAEDGKTDENNFTLVYSTVNRSAVTSSFAFTQG